MTSHSHNRLLGRVTAWLAVAGWALLAAALYAGMMLRAPLGSALPLNSDSLFAAHWAWAVGQDARALTSFPLSRVPSLIDMGYFYLFEAAGLGWRIGLILYGPLTLLGLVLGLGAIAARINGAAFLQEAAKAAALVTAAISLAVLCEAFGLPGSAALLKIFEPVNHGNGFLFALLAIAIPPKRVRFLALCCFLGTLCDMQFVAVFLLPFVLSGLLASGGGHPADLRPAVAAATLAALLALLVQAQLPLSGVDSGMVQAHLMALIFYTDRLALFLADIPENPWFLLPLAGTFWLTYVAMRIFFQRRQAEDARLLMLLALSALGGLLFTVALYDGPPTWRYGHAAIWLPLAVLLPRMRAPANSLGLAALGLGLIGVAHAGQQFWRTPAPLEACLSHTPGLKDGLAEYWYARSTAAMSDWRFHISALGPDGLGRVMNTDIVLHRRDPRDRDKPVQFNFIIMKDLNSPAIAQHYGRPAHILICPESAIWVYDHDLRVPGWSG